MRNGSDGFWRLRGPAVRGNAKEPNVKGTAEESRGRRLRGAAEVIRRVQWRRGGRLEKRGRFRCEEEQMFPL